MEGVGARTGRTSTRYGPATVFNGPVRKWKKKWVHVAPPSHTSLSHSHQINAHANPNGNNGSHLLLFKWAPISQSQNAAANGSAANNDKADDVEEPPRRRFKYIPIALLEEQQNEAAEQVEEEVNLIETEPAETEATTKDEGLDEKPDINDVPMEENQTLVKRKKAKLNPKLSMDLPHEDAEENILSPNLMDLPQDADQVMILNPNLIDVPHESEETLENILGFKLMDLPQETIENILMKLPTKLICSISCASKTVSTIVDTPWFAAHHLSRLLNYSGMNSVSEVPQLMICYRSPDRGESFLQPLKYNGQHNLEKLDSYFLPVSKLVTRSICDLQFAFYNLLLFKERNPYGGPSILFNPLRGEVLKIPGRGISKPRDFKLPRDFYGMGFDSTSNTYKLVCVTFETALVLSPRYPETSPWTFLAVAHVYELGQSSSSWREIQAVPPDYLSPENVCAHGDMHWRVERKDDSKIGERSRIISFDFDKEEFCWTPHPTLSIGCNYFMFEHGHLLNLKGSLAIVDTSMMTSNTLQPWRL